MLMMLFRRAENLVRLRIAMTEFFRSLAKLYTLASSFAENQTSSASVSQHISAAFCHVFPASFKIQEEYSN